MYKTPHTKIYFLQTRAGKLLALGLMLTSGLANGLIMDLVFEKTQVVGVAIIAFFLAFIPGIYLFSRFRHRKALKVYIFIGFYLSLIIFDRSSRQFNTNTAYFIGFSIISSLYCLFRMIAQAEKSAQIALDRQNFFTRGANAYHSHDFKSAIAEFTQSIAFGNRSRAVYYFRGICYGMIDQYPEALADFRMVMDIDPAFEDVYFWRGLTYYSINPNHEQASADFERAVAKCDDEKLKDHAQHYLQAIQRPAAATADSQ